MIFFLIQNQIEQNQPEKWVDLYADLLYRYAILRINNKNLAEDLVQDTFLSALKNIDQFKKKSSIQTWLISILKNKIIDHYRKNFNNSEIINSSDDNDEFNDFQENGMWKQDKAPNSWSKSGDHIFEEQEFLNILQQCLKILPEQTREVFSLREIDGFKSDEICKKLNISSSNLWVLLHRARNGLRKCIEKRWISSKY